MQNIEGLK